MCIRDRVGIGPFVTIPLFVAAMGGPQAIVGWIVGGILVVLSLIHISEPTRPY